MKHLDYITWYYARLSNIRIEKFSLKEGDVNKTL